MGRTRQWGADDGPSLLTEEPSTGAEAARLAALVRQYRAELALAQERLRAARALLEKSRRMRHPMLPRCRHGGNQTE